MGFLGKKLSNQAIIFFFFDVILSFFIVIAVFMKLEDLHRNVYMAYGHYVLIDCLCLFVMSIMLALTTFLKLKKTITSFILGFVILVLVDLLMIKLIEAVWVTNPLFFSQIIMILAWHGLVAFYLQMNSYLIITRRGEKFYSHETLYCYFCFWTDLFSFFWIDFFVVLKKQTRQKLLKKNKNDKARKTIRIQ